MRTKQFKAESKRLLDLMINSIYTHKEIFLRELISNASDAIDKLYYHSLSDGATGLSRSDFAIDLAIDRENRTLTISDNGCGMTEEELENNLGTIAKSGSLAFKQEHAEDQKAGDIDVIGQFGVGFYSAFMVASHVSVQTKAFGSDQAYCWQSSGVEGYTVAPCEKESYGTEIVLTMKENSDDEDYDAFLDPNRIAGLVKKYSNYIRYPIRMDMPESKLKEGCPEDKPEYESCIVNRTLNNMVPIWKKAKSEVSDEDYNQFYQEQFMDYEAPLRTIRSQTEGAATFNALLFVPAHAPFDYYSKEYEKGLQLYASGVLIMDKCADLLPDCFSFVKGLVDSEDLSLNISREMLQHDRQLKLIAGTLEKKIKSELLSMLNNDREKYETFYKSFGVQLKYGIYENYGTKKELLQDLVMFRSSHDDKLTTLGEYVSRMAENQKYIYYACGETVDKVRLLPQIEPVLDQGYEVLYLTDNVDEFALKMMQNYQDKEFRSVSDSDLGLEDDAQKEQIKKQNEESKDLLDALKTALDGKVKEVRLSGKLKTHPVCLSSGGPLTLDMERVLSAMPGSENQIKADRILELNPTHPVFEALQKAQKENEDQFKQYALLLYDQALLMEGMPVDDPVAFSNAICALMAK